MKSANRIFKDLFKKTESSFIKTADMALFEGQKDFSNRSLVWHRFLPGQFTGHESLPEDAQSKILNMMEEFKSKFLKYAVNPKTGQPFTDYRGMLWVMYAHDKAISDQDMQSIPPQLQETADFVNQKGVLLTPEGNKNDSIGQPFWISYNGHAYKDLFPEQVTQSQPAKSEEIRSLTTEKQKIQAQENGWPYGVLMVRPSGKGFSVFLENKEGNKYPLIRGQSYGALRDYFKDKITINSDVALPEGEMGRIIPAPLKRPRKGQLEEHTLSDQSVLNTSQNIRQKAKEQNALYQIKIDNEGALFVVNYSTGKTHYLSESQVQSLINENYINRPLFIIPGVQADISGFGELGKDISKKRLGPWRMTPELIKFLNESDGP
jgi:hypothetical protein